MRKVVLSNQFKKNLKGAKRRALNLDLLTEVVDKLANGEELPAKNRDHNQNGDYAGCRGCHIQPDWLFFYKIEEVDVLLFLFRTETYSDLF